MRPTIEWDRQAWTVAGKLTPDEFAARLQDAYPRDRVELHRMRLRWHVDEFAERVVRPYIEDVDVWSPVNAAHRYVYDVPPVRVGHRQRTTRRLALSTRGVGKSGALKVRQFHATCFGLTRLAVVVQYKHEDAVAWLDTLSSWVREPCDELAVLFSTLTAGGSKEQPTFDLDGHQMTALPRGWSSGLRGLNRRMVRPDRVHLDDIDDERDCATEANRDKQQRLLERKIMPLEPMQGGTEFWWANTPPHHDGTSARAHRRTKGLESWETQAFPAVVRWPESPLWGEVERLFRDTDAYPDKGARYAAAESFYLAHREEMDAGAEVLDPHRMGILRCFWTRLDVGPSAWESEYQVNPRATAGRIFDPTVWQRYRWAVPDKVLRYDGSLRKVADLRRFSHWDWSDGGDKGALATVGREVGRRRYLLSTVRMVRMPLTQQAKVWASEVIRWRVTHPQIETAGGTQSAVENVAYRALRQAMEQLPASDRFKVAISWITTSERKEPRLATLEAPLSNGFLVVDEKMPDAHAGEFEDFDAAKRDNEDNLIDAVQRADERARIGVPTGRMTQVQIT